MHGDIKGTNVPISHTVDALLADFGLADIADKSTVTSLGGSGSLPWQSPEVLRGATHRTFSSDVYSFGMTIYEVKVSASSFAFTFIEEKYCRSLVALPPLMV